MEKVISITDYSSARQFVLDSFAQRSRSDDDFSIRKAAKTAGLSNHVPLLLILQGKRQLHPRHVEWLSKIFDLNDEEKTHFQILVLKDRAKTPKDMQLFLEVSKKLNLLNSKPKSTHEVEYAEITRDPIHAAILSATQTSGGIESISSLAKMFGHLFSTLEITAAVERLMRVGLVGKNEEKYICQFSSTHSGNDKNPADVKNYHSKVLKLAERALVNQDIHEREFQGMAVTVPENKIPEAKNLIRAFMKDFESAMECDPGNLVYQISVQFIRLSASPPNLGSKIQGRPVKSAEQIQFIEN